MRQISELTTGHPCLNYLKELINTNHLLRAHAELPNYDFPLFEGRLSSLKSIMQFRLTCPSLQNKNSSLNEGILTFDKSSGGMKMKRWNQYAISELKSLNSEQLTDQKIANRLNNLNKEWNFTAMAVKRKRHRLNFLKKQNPIINKSAFYVKLSQKKNGLGFIPAYMPLQFVNSYNIKDSDILLFKKNEVFFFSKIRRIIRKDRPNDYYSFHIPFRLIKSTKFNEEQVEFIKKVNSTEKISITSNKQIDILALLMEKINKRIQVCLHPLNENKILIGNERASIPVGLPRYIKLSQELFQSLGFFQGEGTKGNPKRIEVVNTDSNLLNNFLGCLKISLNIEPNQWKARVTYTQNNRNPKLELQLKKYWSKKLNIPANNFVKTKWFNGSPDALKGGVQLYFSSYPLREVWFNLLKLSKDLVHKDNSYAKWFLQGVLAADGCPIFSKGKLHSVMVRIENQEEGELYQSAFKKLGISTNLSVKHRKVSIYNSSELQKINELELFKLHKERNERFKKGLLIRRK